MKHVLKINSRAKPIPLQVKVNTSNLNRDLISFSRNYFNKKKKINAKKQKKQKTKNITMDIISTILQQWKPVTTNEIATFQ